MSWSGFRKQKDGPQQGTLFDVREVPSAPVDSPGMQKRGRRAEMLAAMPPAYAGYAASLRREVDAKISSRRGSGLPEPGTSPGEQAWKHNRAESSRKLTDQTTVPADDLSGLSEIRVGSGGSSGAEAEYVHRDREIFVSSQPNVGTLTHEIGHHVSMHRDGNRPFSAGHEIARLGSGANISPPEEGRADAYALTHAPEARRGSTYANRVKGLSGTSYTAEREARGHPLDAEEREYQGLPLNEQEFGPVQERLFDE